MGFWDDEPTTSHEVVTASPNRHPSKPVPANPPIQQSQPLPAPTTAKCEKCGATETSFDENAQLIICQYCNHHQSLGLTETENLTNDVVSALDLQGWTWSAGTSQTSTSLSGLSTGTCPSCHAEIKVSDEMAATAPWGDGSEPAEKSGSRSIAGLQPQRQEPQSGSRHCHWCRHVVSFAAIQAGGVLPDSIIPFTVTRETAQKSISEYLSKYRFFSDKQFTNTFTPDLIKPVYLPYFVADANAHVVSAGQAAIRKATHHNPKSQDTYDYDLYEYERRFDLAVNNLLVEANSRYVPVSRYISSAPWNSSQPRDSLNIINSILPFTTDTAVAFESRLLNPPFAAEFRDLEQTQAITTIEAKLSDVGAHAVDTTLTKYTHGHRSARENTAVKGASVSSILAPVWLYAYMDKTGKKNYLIVNGQTGKTAACIPINESRLWRMSALIEAVAIGLTLMVALGVG